MKRILQIGALMVVLAARNACAGGFVYESESEFMATGTFDNDALQDVVLVDKQTGDFRIFLQDVDGSFFSGGLWPSGVADVTGFTVGRLLGGSVDALAFTERDFNRINAMLPGGQPLAVPVPSVGPIALAAYDLNAIGNDPARDDLFVASRYSGTSEDHGLTVLQFQAGYTNAFCQAAATGTISLAYANRATFDNVDHPAVVAVGAAGGPDRFDVYDTISGALVPIAQASSLLLTNMAWAYGTFSGTNNPVFLFYTPGAPMLVPRILTGNATGSYAFVTSTIWSFGTSITQVIVLDSGAATRLLILFDDGASATVFDYDGFEGLDSVQTFSPLTGRRYSGAIPLEGDNMLLLQREVGSRVTTSIHRYEGNGVDYDSADVLTFPPMNAFGTRANVLLFKGEPLADPSARLLTELHTGDWTSDPTNLPGPVIVTTEILGDSADGLGSPSQVNLGSSPTNATFALPNQMADDVSVFSYARARGDAELDVIISPPSGRFESNVTVTITGTDSSATTYYRDNSGTWQTYVNPLEYLNQSTDSAVVVAAYIQNADGAKSPIRSVFYEFSAAALTPPVAGGDSDGDLLYDPWEDYFVLDDGSGDADGDGYSNREEMFAGTDPMDDESHPATPPADVSEPFLKISLGGSSLFVRWLWPTQYMDDVDFLIQSTPALTNTFNARSLSVSESGGTNTATISATNRLDFFRLRPTLP